MRLKLLSSFWLHSVFFTALNRLSVIAFSILTYIFLAKKVFSTASEMGVWALFTGIITLIETVKLGLLRNPMIKFLSTKEYRDHKNKIQSSSLVTNIAFSFMVILLIIFAGRTIAGWLHTPQLYELGLWGILIILFLIPSNHCEVLMQANFRFREIFFVYFVKQAIFLVSLAIMYVYFRNSISLTNLVKLQILSTISGALVLYYFARGYFYKGFDFDKAAILKMFHFGKYIFGTNVFASFGRSADQFITAGLISPEVVAYYNVSGRVGNMMDVPSLAVADVLFPKNVEAMSNSGPEKVRYYFERLSGTIISVIIPLSIGIFIFPTLVIRILAGSKYLLAVPILQTTILFSFLRPFNYQFGATMDAIGKPRINFWINLITMLINYTTMYLGLRFIGWMGAAYGSVVAALTNFSIYMFILKRTIGVNRSNIIVYVGESYKQIYRIVNKSLRPR